MKEEADSRHLQYPNAPVHQLEDLGLETSYSD
jgi:hypothetical protein